MTVQILTGDCRELLRTLPDASVQCCVTSPPYHGLRAYGGDPGMIGMEPTIAEHIEALVAVFREVRRVLHPTGTVWLNYGDAYCGNRGNTVDKPGYDNKSAGEAGANLAIGIDKIAATGLKPKDLIGLPWRLAFALQTDGWWLRSAIVWHKPNPMPESVTDRPTSAYEHIFLLSRSGKYYYDAAAIAEPVTQSSIERLSQPTLDEQTGSVRANGGAKTNGAMKAVRGSHKGSSFHTGKTAIHQLGRASTAERIEGDKRNARNVWTIPTQGFSEAHFAVFPPEIPRRCILAGTSEKGQCPACGAPWRRCTETMYENPGNRTTNGPRSLDRRHETAGFAQRLEKRIETTGWQPSCTCDAGGPVPQTILDPFAGAGTTLLVADRLGRHGIGVEVNPDYVQMAQKRIRNDAPLFAGVPFEPTPKTVDKQSQLGKQTYTGFNERWRVKEDESA